MLQIEALRGIVLVKTGELPKSLTPEEVVSLIGYDVGQQKAYGYDSATLEESEQVNKYILDLLDNPQINAYLCKLLPADNYKVSNVTILCAEEIKENIENGLPIFQFGYLPFAITKQHHGLFLHRSGKVFFGARDVFQEDSVSGDLTWRYYNVKTTSWAEAKFDSASVAEILVTLSTDFDVLITDLLNERLGETINKLNHQFAI